MGLGRGCADASQVCPLFLGPLLLGGCGGTLSSTFLWLWCEKSCLYRGSCTGCWVPRLLLHSPGLSLQPSAPHTVWAMPWICSYFPRALGWAGASLGMRLIHMQVCTSHSQEGPWPWGRDFHLLVVPSHHCWLPQCSWVSFLPATLCRVPLAITQCPLAVAIPPCGAGRSIKSQPCSCLAQSCPCCCPLPSALAPAPGSLPNPEESTYPTWG